MELRKQDVFVFLLRLLCAGGLGLVSIYLTPGIPASGELKVTRPLNMHAPNFAAAAHGKFWEVLPLIACLLDKSYSYWDIAGSSPGGYGRCVGEVCYRQLAIRVELGVRRLIW